MSESTGKMGMAGAMRAVSVMKKVNSICFLTQRHNPSTLSNVVFNLSVASGQRFRIDPNRIPYRVIL